MSTAIFVIGVLVFLITVYGTVVAGGLLLTDRQLDEQPELVPDQDRPRSDDHATVEPALELVRSEF